MIDMLVAAISTFGISVGGAYWLSQTLIKHRLARALEIHKSELDQQKAVMAATLRSEVELRLGERAAERQYEYDARRRLYLAIGPLRFQLLVACRDLASRVTAHGSSADEYDFRFPGYYVESFLYRVLRPLALAEIIEREIAYSDFSIDATAMHCLRFKRAAGRILSSDEIVGQHPDVDWTKQAQHVFADSASACANAMIGGHDPGPRVMRFDEFRRSLSDQGNKSAFDPFPRLLSGFQISKKPILWTRLVAYGFLCNEFVNTAGEQVGFESKQFPLRSLLLASGDPYFENHVDETIANIQALTTAKL